MKKLLFIAGLLILLSACSKQEKFLVQKITNSSQIDSIFISELITEKVISKISLSTSNIGNEYNLAYPTVGIIQTKDGKHEYLISLTNNKNFKISINSDSTISTNSLSDSLLNYLWKSNMLFILGFILHL